MPSTFDRFPTVVAMLVIAIVLAACVIKLRDGEGQSKASVGGQPDQWTGKLERCRRVVYEQKDELGECQKVWAEKRRQFFGQGNGTPVRKDRSDPAGLSFTAPAENEGRVPPGRPTAARD